MSRPDLTSGEVDMLRRLGRGAAAFADCPDRQVYQERLDSLMSLRRRGWAEGQTLTEQGGFALAEVGRG